MKLHPGQPIRVNVRGRIFAASVVAVDGAFVDIEPEPAWCNYYRVPRKCIEYARPVWSPHDALR